MDATRSASTLEDEDVGAGETSPYQLTLSALSYSWPRQTAFNVAVGLSFVLVGGWVLALAWILGLCLADLALQGAYRRLAVHAHNVESSRGLTWVLWLTLAKGACWYALPTGFTVLHHSVAGLAFVGVQAVALTALAVSTARNSRRVFLTMVAVPVVALQCCVAAALGPMQGAGALCETLVLSAALWLIGSGTSAVVSNWNQANAHRLQAMAKMRLALARSEIAETQLSEALARAETASRVKSEFLAMMSHEIRTPLNGVLGMAQAMAAGELSGSQRARLGVITTAGQSLLTVFNDLLDLSKIETGGIELEDGVVDIEALAQGAQTFLPLLQDKSVSFSVTVQPQAQRYWRGDPDRIRQVLHYLISNAVKFTHRGAVSVRISEQESALVLAVEDSGIGIAPGRLTQVLEPFVQADASTTRRYGGLGMGLTICRDLVKLMGGSLDLVSVEGVGSTFTMTLPLCAAPATGVIAGADVHPAPMVAGLRVLAAEDNLVNQMVLRTLLEASGISPVLVSNGEEALEAWKTGRWDIVLMDIQMPVMDGVAATRGIRAAERDRGVARTPIIAVTANATSPHEAEYLSAGMDAMVAKPINLAILLEAIDADLEPAASPDDLEVRPAA